MAVHSFQLLSGSTNGRPIPVAATASTGTTIHTAISGTSSYDQMFLTATNVTSSAATLTVEFGGTGSGNYLVGTYSIPGNSQPVTIANGQPIQNALLVTAFSGTASAINISGYVLRIV